MIVLQNGLKMNFRIKCDSRLCDEKREFERRGFCWHPDKLVHPFWSHCLNSHFLRVEFKVSINPKWPKIGHRFFFFIPIPGRQCRKQNFISSQFGVGIFCIFGNGLPHKHQHWREKKHDAHYQLIFSTMFCLFVIIIKASICVHKVRKCGNTNANSWTKSW